MSAENSKRRKKTHTHVTKTNKKWLVAGDVFDTGILDVLDQEFAVFRRLF